MGKPLAKTRCFATTVGSMLSISNFFSGSHYFFSGPHYYFSFFRPSFLLLDLRNSTIVFSNLLYTVCQEECAWTKRDYDYAYFTVKITASFLLWRKQRTFNILCRKEAHVSNPLGYIFQSIKHFKFCSGPLLQQRALCYIIFIFCVVGITASFLRKGIVYKKFLLIIFTNGKRERRVYIYTSTYMGFSSTEFIS